MKQKELTPKDFCMNEQELLKYENIFNFHLIAQFIASYVQLCQKSNTFKPIQAQEVCDNAGIIDNIEILFLRDVIEDDGFIKINVNAEVELTAKTMNLLKEHFIKK